MRLESVKTEQDLHELLEERAEIIIEEDKENLIQAYLDDNISRELGDTTMQEADYLARSLTRDMEILGRIYEALGHAGYISKNKGEGDTIEQQLQYIIHFSLENALYHTVEKKIEELPEEELTAEAL